MKRRFITATIAALVAYFHQSAHAAPETLPVLKPGTTVLFIGDSITDGGRARTGNDYNHTMGQGYAFILSATLGNRLAERKLTFINRGISGNRVTDLKKRWKSDVLDLKPDVLSILIGVNDALLVNGQTVEQFEQTYDQLLQETLSALPSIRIVLGEPFLLPAQKNKDTYPIAFTKVTEHQQVVTRLAQKYKLPLVRYQKVYDAACRRAPADHWSWDGVHPHYAGHSLMAEEWLKTVSSMKP